VKTAILLGLETDVCVAHSAIGLLRNNFQVAVVQDATASPGEAHHNGLSRIRAAGALITNVKSLLYEWMRTLKNCRDFYNQHENYIGNPGIEL